MGRGTTSRAAGAALALWAAAVGCQSTPAGEPMILTQTPPTVQAAFEQDYAGSVIQTITRASRGGQDYYTFQYTAADGAKHDVVFNGAGNVIDKH